MHAGWTLAGCGGPAPLPALLAGCAAGVFAGRMCMQIVCSGEWTLVTPWRRIGMLAPCERDERFA